MILVIDCTQSHAIEMINNSALKSNRLVKCSSGQNDIFEGIFSGVKLASESIAFSNEQQLPATEIQST